MVIFHFNCVLCGAGNKRRDFQDFLNDWNLENPKQTFNLLEQFYSLLCSIHSKTRIDLPASLIERLHLLREAFFPIIDVTTQVYRLPHLV